MGVRETASELGRQIRRARERVGLTQADLAAILGKNQASVSQWESGKRAPSVDDLLAIAEQVQADISELLPSLREPRPQAPALMRALVETLELESLSSSLERFLEHAGELPALPTFVHVAADRPLRAADELLARAQLEDPDAVEPPIDVKRLAVLCGVRVLPFSFAPEENDEGLSGLLIELDDGPVIGVESDQYGPRARFTVAHELGHHLLRHHNRFHVDLATLPSEGSGEGRLYDGRLEREANDFAANLLMPATLVRMRFAVTPSARALAGQFDVSRLAMGYRLVNLGLRETS